MDYDTELWNKYTEENLETSQNELSKFIYYLSVGLGVNRICEAGCNVGNNLSHFPPSFDVHGIDLNEHALKIAKKNYPSFTFHSGKINKIPCSDSFFDLVFTRGVLIHNPKNEIDSILTEFLRVSKKWVFNLEYFGNDGDMIKWKRGDDLLWYRNMKERWSKFNVEIISDIDIPLEIDSGKMRLTIIKKI